MPERYFSKKHQYSGNYVECEDPRSFIQNRYFLQFRTEQGVNIQIANPVPETIVSIHIKEPYYRSPNAFFITIYFDDGSVQMMKSFELKR
jgi:hypothetical protein